MDRTELARNFRNLRARRNRVARVTAKVDDKLAHHVEDHKLERFHLGMVKDEAELAAMEEHLLCCPVCVQRAEESANYVDTIRSAVILGKFDLD
jgi:hypothetical protein